MRAFMNRFSLEAKLPLLITALLLGVVLAIVAASYREVRRSAMSSATERLHLVAEQLSTIAAEGVVRRMATLTDVAADPALLHYLESGDPATQAAARQALSALSPAADTTLPVQLWSAARESLLDVKPGRAEEPSVYAEWQSRSASAPDSGYGPLFHVRAVGATSG